MSTGFTRCQYIDADTKGECDTWFPYTYGQRFCAIHATNVNGKEEVIQISRTTRVLTDEGITKLNEEINLCSQMSIPDLVNHIQSIEEQIRCLERNRRAANIAKRELESKLSSDERDALRAASAGYDIPQKEVHPAKRKSPEEKAKNRKEGFSAWAARLGVKMDELMLMDDDEMASRIAKYKAQKGA